MDRREFLLAAAAAPVALAIEPRALAARLGGTPVAFVTADLESHVVVVDLATASVVTRIRTRPGPPSVESMHDWIAVVAHTEHGVVTLLDAGTYGVRAELDGFEAPRYTVVHPRLPLAYVTDSSREEVVVVDAKRALVLRRVRVPGPARHLSIRPDGRRLLTVLGNAAPHVAVLDTGDARRPELVRTLLPPFPAHDVAFAPDGRTVWLTSGSERRIALYRGERGPTRLLVAGWSPQHVTFSRRKAVVASGDDGTVRRHRLDGELVRDARVPVGSYNVTFGWSRLGTPSLGGGTVCVLDSNGRVPIVRAGARAAHDACIVFGP
jgi:DNA-binding beta-propeller fold protein YncE